MTYDQAQSPRLGQRTSVESTYVQCFDVDPNTPTPDLVEAAWDGQLIFRHDTRNLQIRDENVGAWLTVGSPNYTYVSATMPPVTTEMPPGNPYHTGDVWYDTSHDYQIYIWDESVPPLGAWVIGQEKVLTATVVTSEALGAGDLVNVYDAGGLARVRKACATGSLRAQGYVTAGYAAGDAAKVYRAGTNSAMTGLSVGLQWLSATPGQTSLVPASSVNSMVQSVGYATEDGVLEFNPLIGIRII